MGRITYRDEKETFADHFVAAAVSAVVMLVIVVLGPIAATVGSSGGHDPLQLYLSVKIWGGILVGLAFGAGFVLGPRRMASLWGHFWGTEEPQNEWLSISMWLAVFAIIGIGHSLT